MMKNKFIIYALSICLILNAKQNNAKSSHKKTFIGLGIAGATAASLYGLYRRSHKPEHFKPTVHNLNTITFIPNKNNCVSNTKRTIEIEQLVKQMYEDTMPEQTQLTINKKQLMVHKGIPVDQQEQTVFIFSRGYARTTQPGTNDNVIQKGGCARELYLKMKDNIINHNPCITFDYPDQRRCFSFAQDLDLQCLTTVYNATLTAYPDTDIVLVGDCRGAKAALSFATTQPENLKALVLISPFTSARELTEQIARNHLSWLPYSSEILHKFFKMYFPNYDETKDNLTSIIGNIKTDLPIFIAHRKGDALVADATIQHLEHLLKETGHKHVHVLMINDKSAAHSRLAPVLQCQQGVNAFLKKYGLPHDAVLAEQGKKLLAS